MVVASEDVPDVIRNGGRFLSMVSEDSVLVSMETDTGAPGLPTVAADSKVSAVALSGNYVVVFHPDVPDEDAQEILIRTGVVQFLNKDLLSKQYLVSGNGKQAVSLSQWDEVAYIFPASEEMFSGIPLFSCAGPLTEYGPIGQYISTFGDGWDGPGRGRATLTYSLEKVTEKLPLAVIQTAIEKAALEWGRVVNVRFSPSGSPAAAHNANVLFASGAHGDSYPFDGRGRVLAHTFYPPPINSEPIAGDIHIDEDELWGNGGEVDLYSVILHELGHGLGLGHSDRPQSVMYPYYRNLSVLQDDDIAAVQRLYAAPDVETPIPRAVAVPLSISVIAPSSSSQASVNLRGLVSGGMGDVQITWSSGPHSGIAKGDRNWTAENIPLTVGENTIRVVALDASGTTVSRVISVLRGDTPIVAPVPSPGPSESTDTSKPTLTVSMPALTISATSATTARIAGTARDNIGITAVTWASGGRSGTASGTSSWTFDVPLYVGDNAIVVRAADAGGNSTWRSLTITRR